MRRMKRLLSRRFFLQLLGALVLLSAAPCLLFNFAFKNRIKEDMIAQARQIAENNLAATSLYVSETFDRAQLQLYSLLTDFAPVLGVNGLKELDVLGKMHLLASLKALANGSVGEGARFALYDTKEDVLVASLYGITDLDNPRFRWLQSDLAAALAARAMTVTAPRREYDSSRMGYYYYCAVIQPPTPGGHVAGLALLDLNVLMSGYMNALKMDRASYSFYIVDAADEIIYPNGNAETSLAPASEAHIRVTQTVSGVGLRLLADIDSRLLFAQVDATARAILLISLATAAALIAMAVALSLRLYRPVDRLVSDVESAPQSARSEFATIRQAYATMRDRYADAVRTMEDACRKLRRAQLIGNMRGEAYSLELPEEDAYMVCLLLPDAETPAVRLQEALSRALPEGELFEEDGLLVYACPYPGDVARAEDALAREAPDGQVFLANEPRPMRELRRSYAEILFARSLAELTEIPRIASLRSLYALARVHEECASVEALLPALREERAEALEELLPLGLTVERFNGRLFVAVLLLLDPREDASALLRETGEALRRETSDMTPGVARKLVARLVHALNARTRAPQTAPDVKGEALRAIDRYIAQRYHTLFSLDDVACGVGIPRQKLGEWIKEAYGISFTNYLNQYRVERAKHMLARGDMRLESVSAATGFSSNSYFIKVFKGFTGLTPGEYRNYLCAERTKNHEDDAGI